MASFELCAYQEFLETPPLWVNKEFGIQQFKMPGIDVGAIARQPIPKNIRLGHKMEYVFQQCLASQQHYKFLHSNIQVKKDAITKGEIDFLLENIHSGQVLHVELTYKFYIINTAIAEPIYQLIGPNKRDMFVAKLNKIKNNQFPLIYSEEGTSTLRELGIDTNTITQQVCYKAQLFKPYQDSNVRILPLNQDCIIGFWMRFETFKTSDFKDSVYYIPIKDEWILKPNNKVSWITHNEVLLEVNILLLKENSPMIWMRKTDGIFQKFFVVWW